MDNKSISLFIRHVINYFTGSFKVDIMSLSVLIPRWFFGIDVIFYVVALLIGLATAYYAYKVYAITGKKQHLYLFMGFVILSIGFLSLVLTSSYISVLALNPEFVIYNTTFDIMDFGFIMYYLISVVAYVFFNLMYLPEQKKTSIFGILPWWFVIFPFFHLFSVLLLAFPIFKSFVNWNQNRSRSSFAVFVAFGCIGLFHLLSFMTFSKAMFYVLANVFLILGFLSLLLVLFRVSRR